MFHISPIMRVPKIAKKALGPRIRNFLFTYFKYIFYHTVAYQHWKTHRDTGLDESYRKNILAKSRKALQSSRHPSWHKFPVFSPIALLDGISSNLCLSKNLLILTFGHNDYTSNIGGVQLCVGIEQNAFYSLGYDYLYLYPAIASSIMLDEHHSETQVLGIVLNGKNLGYCTGLDLTRTLATICTKHDLSLILILQSLLGHCAHYIIDLKTKFNILNTYFWIHDFYYLCPSMHLLMNNMLYCDAPHESSSLCSVCIYGEYRHTHLARMHDLFDAYSITAIAPSQFALNYWKSRSTLPIKQIIVHNHTRACPEQTLVKDVHIPLQVGFLGNRTYHKGWHAFADLADSLIGDSRYAFHAFMQSNPHRSNIQWCRIKVTNRSVNAMVDALVARNMDVVVLWSQCPETYSFTMYEAMASGAFIVTTIASGNIAYTIKETKQGIVLNNEAELLELFHSGKILDHYSRFCNTERHRGRIEHNQMTADIFTHGQ